MKVPKRYSEHVASLVNYFAAVLGISHYRLILTFKSKREDKETAAEIDINTVYEHAVIYVYPRTLVEWKEKNWGNLANIVCHELCHIVTDPLYKEALWSVTEEESRTRVLEHIEEARERLTEQVAKAVLRVAPKSAYTPQEDIK